jgi:hypothetical protein
MDEMLRRKIVISLISELRASGSWCGETHVQKGMYLLKEVGGIPIDHDFILYKHGPYSFELKEEMMAMRADGLLKTIPQPAPYGPSLGPGPNSALFEARSPSISEKIESAIKFVASEVGSDRVTDLEKICTAVLVIREGVCSDGTSCANRLHELKPHVPIPDARIAVERAYRMLERSIPPRQPL